MADRSQFSAVYSFQLVLIRDLAVALVLSAVLCGGFLSQCIVYWRRFGGANQDRLIFRLLVAVLATTSVAYVAINLAILLTSISRLIGPRPETILFPTDLQLASNLTFMVLAASSEMFFIYRSWVLWPEFWVPIIGLSILTFLAGCYAAFTAFQFKLKFDPTLFTTIATINLGTATSATIFEIWIGVVLCWRLRKAGELKIRPEYDPVMQILSAALATSVMLIPITIANLVVTAHFRHYSVAFSSIILRQIYAHLSALCSVFALNQRAEIRERRLSVPVLPDGEQEFKVSDDPGDWRGDQTTGSVPNVPVFRRGSEATQGSKFNGNGHGIMVARTREEWDDDRILVPP